MNNKYSQKILRQQATDWLIRLQSDSCSEAERQAFADWLVQDARHRQMYQQVQTHWHWLAQFKNVDFPERQQALRYQPPRKSVTKIGFYGFASVLLLIFGLTAFTDNGWLGISQRFVTAKGERQALTLADGSSLELNTDSEVQVHLNHWQRHIELVRGEVFFKVAHDEQRPFEVKAANGVIRDIGTAFDVYIQDEQVLVAVQEGIVDVEAAGNRQLLAGQQIAFNHNGEFQHQDNLTVAGLTAWRQGKLVFQNKTLKDVLAELGRYHNTHISLQNQELNALRVSGTFNTDNLDNALNAISLLLPVHIRHATNQEIILESGKSSVH